MLITTISTIFIQRFKEYLRIIYFLITLIVLLINFFSQGIGLPVGLIISVMIQYQSFRLKILSLMVIAVQMYKLFDTIDYNILIYSIAGMYFMFIGVYELEFKIRKSFCVKYMHKKQTELIKQIMKRSMFIISLNPRTNQFQTEFYNDSSKTQYSADDNEKMKDLLRNISIIVKQENSFHDMFIMRSVDGSMKKSNIPKKLTLEEFVFNLYNDLIKDKQDERLQFYNGFYEDQPVKIHLKPYDIGKKTIVIVIEEERNNLVIEKQVQQKQYLNRIVNQVIEHITTSQVHVFKSLQCLKINNHKSLLTAQCINLSIMNKYYNFSQFLQIHREQFHQGRIKPINLSNYLGDLSRYLKHFAEQQKKSFKLEQLFKDGLIVKLNEKFLTQVIINLFEMALQQSKQEHVITLYVHQQNNIDPLRKPQDNNINNKKDKYNKTDPDLGKIESDESAEDSKQQVIKFSIVFTGQQSYPQDEQDELILNPTSVDHFAHNNYAKFDIIPPITKMLISKLGPYKEYYFQSQTIEPKFLDCPSFKDINMNKQYFNCYFFFIYTDQSKIKPSFFQLIRQESFLVL
ncbi:hypothetical protein pb186bvf_007083 [Paramecium bursaria]